MLKKRTLIVAMALVALCVGAFGSQALAGKKKKTNVVVNSGPVLTGQQKVKVSGSLNTTTACLAARSMRLFLTDVNGAIQATIDSGTSFTGGDWKLSAKLANPPTPDQYLQVKAKKLTVGKFVCKAGLSRVITIN